MSAIDPGVDQQIEQTADDIEHDRTQGQVTELDEDDFFLPSRWWFASTACPLVAGTLGPIASGFNVCSLSTYWREALPPKGSNEPPSFIKDPDWLIAVNALSLLAAVTGNASLLLHMGHRITFSVSQPITIIGFFLAGILLIADMAALTSSSDYMIANPEFQPGARHGLTAAFYFAIFAATWYMLISLLMCLTVFGALRGHYEREFQLTSSQRTLMLQTMSFIIYLLLGALVFNVIEGWGFLNSVYWANVTLLTIGIGDFSPFTALGRGLLFPFAIGGVLIVGLVVGSIRSLVLERGKEKMSARIMEKRRRQAVHNVDQNKDTIKISIFAKADLSLDPNMSPAQRREEEFNVMRKVLSVAANERKYYALAGSSAFALMLWFVGALIFMKFEYLQRWSYFNALYFAFTSLLTIGYGDFAPKSHGGKAFFVFWSILAIPSLTILISNMGDTVVKWVSDLTNWVGRLTVLPSEDGFRATMKREGLTISDTIRNLFNNFTGPGVFGVAPIDHTEQMKSSEYEERMLDRFAERLAVHIDKDDSGRWQDNQRQTDDSDNDTEFYHYVLARECRNLQKDLGANPPKMYEWSDWEYFLKLMGDEDDPVDYPYQQHPDIMVPDQLRAPYGLSPLASKNRETVDGKPGGDGSGDDQDDADDTVPSVDGNVERKRSVQENLEARRKQYKQQKSRNPDAEPSYLHNWSWLSNQSPLMSNKSEAWWILERLSAALERELNRQRKGYKRKPPITLRDAYRNQSRSINGGEKDTAQREAQAKQQRNLEKAAEGAE